MPGLTRDRDQRRLINQEKSRTISERTDVQFLRCQCCGRLLARHHCKYRTCLSRHHQPNDLLIVESTTVGAQSVFGNPAHLVHVDPPSVVYFGAVSLNVSKKTMLFGVEIAILPLRFAEGFGLVGNADHVVALPEELESPDLSVLKVLLTSANVLGNDLA